MSVQSLLLEGAGVDAFVPGSPAQVTRYADTLAAWAKVLDQGGKSLRKVDPAWAGEAARQFRSAQYDNANGWVRAADAFTKAASAVERHADALSWSRRQVVNAKHGWEAGMDAARAAHDARVQAEAVGGAFTAVVADPVVTLGDVALLFETAGAEQRARAVAEIEHAQQEANNSAARAATVVKDAVSDAPQARRWWQDAPGKTLGVLEDAGRVVYNESVVPGVNATADVLAAMWHDPADTLKTAFGVAGVVAGGQLAGGGLASTPFSWVVGPEGEAASAGAIAAGVGIAAGGAAIAGKGVNGIRDQAARENMNVLQQRSEAARKADPGYGKTPARSSSAGKPPEGAAPYKENLAKGVEPWGKSKDKTAGLVELRGDKLKGTQYEKLLSGVDKDLKATVPTPRTGTGRNGRVINHVEGHTGMLMRDPAVKEATLYLNRLPCGGQTGCDAMLKYLVPKGKTLTVYGPDDFVTVVRGLGQ